jgi:hypothetical protein
VVRKYGNPDDFVGHVGGDDFVVVTTPERAHTLCSYICEHYKEESTDLYRTEDLRRGSISGVDRKGRSYQFPLVSLSIGVVNNQIWQPHSIEEVSYLAAEAKNYAKQSDDKVYHMPPRRVFAGHDASSYAPSRYVASSPLPPTLAQIAQGHAHHYSLFGIEEEENILEEYEQKV